MTPATVLVARGVHALGGIGGNVRAVMIESDRITWAGDEPGAAPARAPRVVDLGDAWLTPAFVDAHVHGTATGFALSGLTLDGVGSVGECLDRVRDHAAGSVALVHGSGWDHFGWPEGRPPTAAELSAAASGRTVLLERVDGHSCLVTPDVLASLPLATLAGVDRDEHGLPSGWLKEQAAEAARRVVHADLGDTELHAARRATCERAAALGIASFHEMGHPGLSGFEDARSWAAGEWPVEVLVWWAELDPDPAARLGGDAAITSEPPRLRPGGDLFLDGSIGSETAAVSCGYPGGGHGELFHDDDAVAAFFSACSQAGRGAGVHAIGDRAIEQAVAAIETAAEQVGAERVRRSRHRIEHVELPTRDHVRRMAALGIVASMQPAFDAVWGGSEGLYAARFGAHTALRSNPVGWFFEAGVRLAFGSDSTVTRLDPWGGVMAAVNHRGGARVDRGTAVAAHTLGGRYAAGQDDVGRLLPGFRADLAVWDADPLTVPDPTVVSCLATIVRGRVAFGDLALNGQ